MRPSQPPSAPLLQRSLLHVFFILLVLMQRLTTTEAWDWMSDWLMRTVPGGAGSDGTSTSWLTFEQVVDLRVRDIKRRLARTHGYSAEELAKMILKKELIEALAFEEEKTRLRHVESLQRALFYQGIVVAIVAVLVVVCWPLITQAYEVVLVNFVVYTDRKKLEARKSIEFRSTLGLLGVCLMFAVDILQMWLTVSVLLSWILPSSSSARWILFPTPNIPIRPAQFMGGPMNQAFGGYGINIGSMVVTWGLRFLHGRLELWTGKCLAASRRRQQQKQRNSNRSAAASAAEPRPTSRRQARREARQAAAAASATAVSGVTTARKMPPPPPDLPPSWDRHPQEEQMQAFPTTKEHDVFMDQLHLSSNEGGDDNDENIFSSGLDSLD